MYDHWSLDNWQKKLAPVNYSNQNIQVANEDAWKRLGNEAVKQNVHESNNNEADQVWNQFKKQEEAQKLKVRKLLEMSFSWNCDPLPFKFTILIFF